MMPIISTTEWFKMLTFKDWTIAPISIKCNLYICRGEILILLAFLSSFSSIPMQQGGRVLVPI